DDPTPLPSAHETPPFFFCGAPPHTPARASSLHLSAGIPLQCLLVTRRVAYEEVHLADFGFVHWLFPGNGHGHLPFCASFIRRRIRRYKAGESHWHHHQRRMEEPAHLVLRRREKYRWHGDELGVRRWSSRTVDAPGHHEGSTEARRDDRRRGLPRERRIVQRFGRPGHLPRRPQRAHGQPAGSATWRG